MIEADVTLPAATIPPGVALAETNTHLEVLGRIPVESIDGQYLRVTDSEDREAFEAAARADPGVERLVAIDREATASYYQVVWRTRPPCPALYRSDLLVERMEGTPAGWSFRLRAGNGEALQALQGDCRDRGRPFGVDRLDRSATSPAGNESGTDSYGLTERQRAILMRAIEAGFFAIPRETTLAELAEEFDISDQAVSDHLRRAQWNVLQATVLAERSAGSASID